MHKLVKTFVNAMGNAYPQLKNDEEELKNSSKMKRLSFYKLFDKGIQDFGLYSCRRE